MQHTSKTLPGSQIELHISVEPAEYQKHMDRAAIRISERVAIRGFRKGKVPYDIIKREVGEMNILNEALEAIVQESFYNTVKEAGMDTIGMPNIEIEKIAPGNELTYKATVAILPEIKLPPLSDISVGRTVKEVTDEQVNEVVDMLRGMHASEISKSGEAGDEDVVMIDMDMKDGLIPIEGGQAKNYRVHLSEKHYIPGFNDQLKGVKKDDTRNFILTFPETHYQKNIAGKAITFDVAVKEVYKRQLPELTDDFAKKMGKDTTEELKNQIKINLREEAEQKADQQAEIGIFDAIIDKSSFGEIPEVLVDAERRKMFYELQRDLERNGVSIEQYLDDIKKTKEEIYNDFKAQAEKRAKSSLISRHIAEREHIAVPDEDVEKELDMMRKMYKDNDEYAQNLKKPEVKDTIRTIQQNKKVLTWLKEKILKQPATIQPKSVQTETPK